MAQIFGQLHDKLVYQAHDDSMSLLTGHPLGVPSLDTSSALAEQVRLFNISKVSSSESLLDIHDTQPEIEGSDEQPDVKMKVELVSYHAPSNMSNDRPPNATLRLDIGQDESSSSSIKPLFWSIAAGLDLAAAAFGFDAPKKFRQDFHTILSRRSIEVGGGLCEFRFELVH